MGVEPAKQQDISFIPLERSIIHAIPEEVRPGQRKKSSSYG